LPTLLSADSQNVVLSVSEPPIWAPESIEVAELIGYLLETGTDEACLLDEFGGFSGMFSASMAIQSIFSDVFQYDDKKVSSASITLRGSQGVEEVLDFLPDVLKAHSGEFRTLNGVLSNYLGRIPKSGEAFAIGAFKFYIISSIPTRIEMVLIQKGENNDS
jgi:putative hemolysin